MGSTIKGETSGAIGSSSGCNCRRDSYRRWQHFDSGRDDAEGIFTLLLQVELLRTERLYFF